MLKREGYFEFRLIGQDTTTETKIKAEVKILDKGFVENLQLIFYHFDRIVNQVDLQYEGKENKEGNTKSVYVSHDFTLEKSGVYWFYFTLQIEGKKYYVTQNEEFLMTHKKTEEYPNEYCWRLDVKDANLKEYPQWTGKTTYQLMSDRFCIGSHGIIPVEGRNVKNWEDRMPEWKPDEDGVYRNEYFYGGNLEGVAEKVSYLKNLGFDTVYMCPIFKSNTYHHYNPEDYGEIDSMLGTWEDYRNLANIIHENGMSLIGDMVFNHTSDKHPYFQSISDSESPYKEYYNFQNGEPVTWYGFKDLPELNKENPKVQEEMRQTLKKYLSNGMDAVRLDLGEILPEKFLRYLETLKEEYLNLIFINEMWGIATDKYSPQIFDGQADSVMNYPMTDAIMRWVRTGNYMHFNYIFNRVYGEYPREVQNRLMNILSSHDTPTAITMLVGKNMNENPYEGCIWDIEKPWRYPDFFDTYAFREFESNNDELVPEDRKRGEKLLKIAIAILYTIPGNPCIFMGTENAESGYKDPFCRKPMNWKNPNLPMHRFLKSMGCFRKDNGDILSQGESRIRSGTNDVLLILERYNGRESIVLIVNRSETEYNISKEFQGYNVLFAENSTKDKIGGYGILILRRN